MAPLSRRDFLKASTAGITLAVVGGPSFQAFAAATRRKINIIGLGVTVQERIMARFREQTGHDIAGTLAPELDAMNRMLTGQNRIFDSVEINVFTLKPMWEAGVIQSIPIDALPNWKYVTGFYAQDPQLQRLMYADESKKTLRFVPIVGNFDSFAYLPHRVTEVKEPTEASWSLLYDSKYAGKVAIGDFPTQTPQGTALHLVARGLMPPPKRGYANLTREEYDFVIDYLIDLKKKGHFRTLWSDYGQLVNLLASEEVWLSDAWNPVVEDVKKLGTPCKYALAREGTRAWVIGIMMSSQTRAKEVVYDYANFWLSGWPGAQVASQGYYSPVPELVRKYLPPEEFGYWYEGKPNSKGEVREGGSFEKRAASRAFWDQWPDEYPYMIRRWQDFRNA